MKYIFIKIVLIFFICSASIRAEWDLTQKTAEEKLIDSLLTKAESLVASNSAESIAVAEKAGQLAEKTDNTLERARVLSIQGCAYKNLGNNIRSIECFEKALTLFKKFENIETTASTLNNLGTVYRYIGKFDKALARHLEALEIYIQLNDTVKKAYTYVYLGLVYRNIDNLDMALEYYLTALQTSNDSSQNCLKSEVLNHIGSLYWYKGDNIEALEHYKRSLRIRRETAAAKDKIAGSLNNIGNVYRKMSNNKEALKYYNESLSLSRKIGDQNLIATTLKNTGILYMNEGSIDKAESYLLKSLKLSRKINFTRIINENLTHLPVLYFKKGNFHEAYEFSRISMAFRDSLSQNAADRKIAELKYEYDIVQKENKINALQIEKQESFLKFLLTASGLAVILFIVVFSRYRIKSRAAKIFIRQNEKISKINNQLSISNKNLEQSERTYRYLFEKNALPMLIFDRKTLEIIAVNLRAADLYGYSDEEFINLTMKDLLLKGEESLEINSLNKSSKDNFAVIHTKHITKNKKIIDVETHSFDLIFNGLNSVQVLINDITERVHAENVMRESEEKFRRLFESTPDAIFLVDAENGIVIDANPAAQVLLEMDLGDVINHHYKELNLPDILECRLTAPAELVQKQKNSGLFITKENGTRIPVESTLVEFAFSRKQVVLAVIRDVSERTRLEDQLRQMQKLEAVGQLAGGVAHDFNNLLTVIRGYSDLMLLKMDENNPLFLGLKQIDGAAQRAESLTRQLLAFSRKQIMKLSVLDLNTIISEMNKMLVRLIGENIELVTDLNESIGRIKADKGQIEQTIMNLVVNARDALSEGGRIRIKTSEILLTKNNLLNEDAEEGHYVVMSIEDNGTGMDKETADRIFEPFFSTKEKHKGTGLGLSTVYGIIKQIKGHITVESEPGSGTIFRIFLPRMVENVPEKADRKLYEPNCNGNETILVVEDENLVRRIICDSLRQKNYNVLEAADGKSAAALYEEYDGAIHLVISDVVMPKMNGKEFVDQITAAYPEVKVIFMSGYTDHSIVHDDGILNEGTEFIQKPFTPADLAKKVRSVLDKYLIAQE